MIFVFHKSLLLALALALSPSFLSQAALALRGKNHAVSAQVPAPVPTLVSAPVSAPFPDPQPCHKKNPKYLKGLTLGSSSGYGSRSLALL